MIKVYPLEREQRYSFLARPTPGERVDLAHLSPPTGSFGNVDAEYVISGVLGLKIQTTK